MSDGERFYAASTATGTWWWTPLKKAIIGYSSINLPKVREKNVMRVFIQWLGIVSAAVIYNYIFIIGRAVFWDMQNLTPITWLVLDYVCDFIYLLDAVVHAHEGLF